MNSKNNNPGDTKTEDESELAGVNSMKYTQRAWDRIVGIGKVPAKYALNPQDDQSED